MKLLLDEMFSPLVARQLRELGHDVIAIAERPDWHGYSDPQVFELARREHRALVTNNVRDFRPLHNEALAAGQDHFGIVFAPGDYARARSHTGLIVAALAARLDTHPSERDLANGEDWL